MPEKFPWETPEQENNPETHEHHEDISYDPESIKQQTDNSEMRKEYDELFSSVMLDQIDKKEPNKPDDHTEKQIWWSIQTYTNMNDQELEKYIEANAASWRATSEQQVKNQVSENPLIPGWLKKRANA